MEKNKIIIIRNKGKTRVKNQQTKDERQCTGMMPFICMSVSNDSANSLAKE